MSRRFAESGLGVEIYRFKVSMYRIGEIVIFCVVFMHFDHINLRISQLSLAKVLNSMLATTKSMKESGIFDFP